MRIAFVSPVVPFPPKAGVILRAHHLLKGLALKHDVDLFSFIQEPLLESFYEDIAAGLLECQSNLEAMCHSVTLIPIDRAKRFQGKLRTVAESLFQAGGYKASWLYSRRSRAELARYVQSVRYDATHFDSISVVRFQNVFQPAPSVLGHHNAESDMLARRAQHQTGLLGRHYFRREAARLARFEAATASAFSLNVTCSDLDTERLRATMPDSRFVTVPNGVDLDFFKPAQVRQRPNSLIFVGTMSWYPNHQAMNYFLREVWPLLCQRIPGVTLDIVGASAPASLVKLASESRGVVVHGFVEDIRPLLDSASIFVCPISDGGGTKLKLLDAFAMAKCVVAHPIACEGINVTNDVNVVFASAVNEYVESLVDLLSDPKRRYGIGDNARRLVEQQYSFAAIGSLFADLVADVALLKHGV